VTISRWINKYNQEGESAFAPKEPVRNIITVSLEDKLRAAKEYLAGKGTIEELAAIYNVSYSMFYRWIVKYKTYGENIFFESGKKAKYTSSFKEKVIRDYLSNKISFKDLAIKYRIHSETTVENWVLKYNGHENIKNLKRKGYKIMTKGRKTTFNERIEIVQYCIKHQNNYAKVSQVFNTSYQQVFSWCKKYEIGGVEALKDKRGQVKPENEMTELEKVQLENKLLQAENKRIQMENDFLKKLAEIERGRF
jgi:transposase-like protein